MARQPDPAAAREAVPAAAENGALLDVRGLAAGYGARQVIFDVDVSVKPGEVVAILGHNGAGKSTTIKSLFGLVRPLAGTITYKGQDVGGRAPAENVRDGMSFTPPERFVFPDITVLHNLKLGGITEKSEDVKRQRMERIYELFPILRERSKQLAGTMSGGQQRMVSIGIALMSGPRLMLLDEPSLGLAPALVHQVLDAVSTLAAEENISVILLEQNVTAALEHAHRAYIMRSGRVILEEPAEEMRARGHWWDLF